MRYSKMSFWLQSSFVVYVLLISAASADRFQTFSILPTQIHRNPFFTSSSSTNCEQERTNCINKCTEENMLFFCNSLLTLVSTCTCISPPSISHYIQNESLRCKIARLQCLGTCGPNPNFQCQDSGTEISESCSCSDVSTEDNNIKQENNSMSGTFSSAEAISQVNSTVVDTIDSTDINNTTNITVLNGEDIEESSGIDSVKKYENSDNSIAFARSTAIVQSSNKTEEITETATLNKSVQKNEDDDDSDDEEVEGDDEDDEEDDDEEGEDQDSTLSAECEKAKADCQTQCKNLEIDFDCQSKGGALSQSCACVSQSKDLSPSPSTPSPKSPTPTPTPTPTPSRTLTPTEDTDMHAQNVTTEIAIVDEVADEPLNEVSRNNYIQSDKNQVDKVALEPECEQAKKECENTCGNMEIDFDCQSNGGAFSQSCACVSENKILSPSPSTPSPKSPTPTPTPDSSAKPPTATSTPTPATPTPTPSPKMTNNTSNVVAKSAAVVSTDTNMHAFNTTLEDTDMHAQNVTVDEVADEPLTEVQINNYAMEPECEQAKKECENTCMDMEIDFDCKKVGINLAKSCACVSENVNVGRVNAISDVLDLQNEP